jgi:hypothetical protein
MDHISHDMEDAEPSEYNQSLNNSQQIRQEYVQREIPCSKPVNSTHDTVLAVDRFLSQSNNQEFQRQYEYIAEFEEIEGTNNFLATFRLRRQFREQASHQAAPSIDQVSQHDQSKQRFRDTGVS